MENIKKSTEKSKEKGIKKSLNDLTNSFKTDGDKIHGGVDVKVTTDVPKG